MIQSNTYQIQYYTHSCPDPQLGDEDTLIHKDNLRQEIIKIAQQYFEVALEIYITPLFYDTETNEVKTLGYFRIRNTEFEIELQRKPTDEAFPEDDAPLSKAMDTLTQLKELSNSAVFVNKYRILIKESNESVTILTKSLTGTQKEIENHLAIHFSEYCDKVKETQKDLDIIVAPIYRNSGKHTEFEHKNITYTIYASDLREKVPSVEFQLYVDKEYSIHKPIANVLTYYMRKWKSEQKNKESSK